jgi:hypothetical protein
MQNSQSAYPISTPRPYDDQIIIRMINEAARYDGAVHCYVNDTHSTLSSAIPEGLTIEETRAVIRSAVNIVCGLLPDHVEDLVKGDYFILSCVYDEKTEDNIKYMNCWVLQTHKHEDEEHIIDLYSCYKNIDGLRKRKRKVSDA